MLAVVKKPHIELSIHGENATELIAWIQKKFEVEILTSDEPDIVPIEKTDFWQEMQVNRVGNLLAGARLKAGMTQAELADKMEIQQNMIRDYERGKRKISGKMAKRFGDVLDMSPDCFVGSLASHDS